jgi:hypothetical protein
MYMQCNMCTCLYCFYNLDFSFDQWLRDNSVPAVQPLPGYAVTKLLHELGIAEYLLEDPCDSTSSPYIPSVQNWSIGSI